MLSLILRTIAHFRNLLIPVVAGVAVAGAVIVGALIVGDSVRGSLRHIALDRIGKINRILLAPRWFSPALLDKTQVQGSVQELIYLQQATAQHEVRNDEGKKVFRANELTLMGVDASFWELSEHRSPKRPSGEQVVLNQSAADTLQVRIGDLITLRVAASALVPAESALGKREQDTYVMPRWEVVDILPDEGLARFSLRSDQRPPVNAFVDKKAIQQAIEIGDQVNAMVTAIASTEQVAEPMPVSLLERFRPGLADLGLQFDRVQASNPRDQSLVIDYDHITTDQMLLPDTIANEILGGTEGHSPKPILTYLANNVERKSGPKPADSDRPSVPYSTISAVDWELIAELLKQSNPSAEPIAKPEGDEWIVINQWLADELKLAVGDRLTIDYFLPETVEGEEIEKQFEATVVAIAPLTEPKTPYLRNRPAAFEQAPTPFNDPQWTPTVPGITDQDSISKWDTPFPLKRTIDSRDDDYWNSHRLTPKLFMPFERGKKLFGSRFGTITSIRFDGLDDTSRESVKAKVQSIVQNNLSVLGWRELPLREQQLARSSGTTPFDALFLSLSFFLIAAALLLVALLFRLSIERRANHWGLLAATGWTRSSIRKLLLAEGAILAAMGATAGIGLGMLYAYAMITLLKTWWVGAITVSFLDYYVMPTSLIAGWVASWGTALVAIYIASRRIAKSPITLLLRGKFEEPGIAIRTSKWSTFAVGISLLAGLALLGVGVGLQGQAQAGAFVGAGMLFMICGLVWVWSRLRRRLHRTDSIPNEFALASSSASRAPARSILAIALVAIASFLILSMSLFQATPTEPGMGGFVWMGKSSSPIYTELGNAEARRENLAAAGDAWSDIEIVSLRVRGGDDASCNNLYQANEPQVLGMSPRIVDIDRQENGTSRFAWFQSSASKDQSPWTSLEQTGNGTKESPIPVVLDQNTALWALHLGGYVGEVFSFEFDGAPIFFKTAGVLQNTILQGSLIIGEENFKRMFPTIAGYKSFLVEVPPNKRGELPALKSLLENGWEEQGLDLVESSKILSQLLAVQNTYLSAFQLLGALGLLLGTVGLGVTQIRGALERRAELASMRALGFTKRRLVWILTLENSWQLFRGLTIGGAAAALATIPALLAGQPFGGLITPLLMLGLILVVGGLTSWFAASFAMRWPLLAALRSET
ncbi:FtsX-like permease family protein [Pirellulaceae bacterium SH467]